MFNAAKDALSSRAAQAWANNLISRYGKVEELKIDSRSKTVDLTCQLEGEATPITVRIVNYVLEQEGERTFIRATGFNCSRPWLQHVLSDHGVAHRIELPTWAIGLL
jgi:hypothetical protein